MTDRTAFVGAYTLASVRSFRGMMWRAKHVDRAAAYVVAKNAELYRRLAEGPTESTRIRGICTKETEETK